MPERVTSKKSYVSHVLIYLVMAGFFRRIDG